MDLDAFNRSEWNDSPQPHTVYSSNHSTGHPRMTSEGCPEIPSPNSSSGSSVDSSTDGCTEENMGSEMSENPGQPETNSNQIPVSAPDSFSDHSLNNLTAPFSSQQGYTNPVNTNQGSVYPMLNGFPTPISSQSNEFSVSSSVYGFADTAPLEDIIKPTLTPKEDFCVEHDCERLKGALDRLNIVEKEIVEVMGRRPVVQRIAILQTYKSLYKDNLFAIFNSKLTGYLKDCLIALCYTPAEFDAIELHRAMRGTDTDEDTIVEILCTKTNEQIRRIKDVYPKLFDGCDLMNDVNNQITHPFKRIFMTLLKADRDEFTFVDRNIVQRDVEELSNTIQQNIRIDESKFILILASRSYAHLRVVFNEYIRISKHTMEDTLKLRMRGNALSALLSIVRCIQNKPRYFAEKLFKAMQCAETADKALIRIVVSRCEIDMKNIMKEFYKITGNTLDECIDFNIWSLGNEPTNLFIDRTLWNETPSNYRRLLLKLIRG